MIHGATVEFCQRFAEGLNRLADFFKPVQKFAALDSARLPAGRVNREGRWP